MSSLFAYVVAFKFKYRPMLFSGLITSVLEERVMIVPFSTSCFFVFLFVRIGGRIF